MEARTMEEKLQELNTRRDKLSHAMKIIDNTIKAYKLNPSNPFAIDAVNILSSK